MSPNNVVLKFIWYIISRLLVWAAAAGLVVLAFFAAMDYMNASLLMKDGLQVRADVIIKGSDPTTLTKVFSKSFLENDEMLYSNIYQQYSVTSFDYKADSSFALIFPWQSTVKFRVTEKVSNIKPLITPSAESGLSEEPPAWQNAEYEVTLVRHQGSWRIVSMELVRVLPSPSPSLSASANALTSSEPGLSSSAGPTASPEAS